MWLPYAGILGGLIFAQLAEIIGRRKSGMLCQIGAVASLLGVAFYFQSGLPIFFALMLCAKFFNMSGFTVGSPYIAEMFPTHLRATGLGSANGFGGFGKLLGPLAFAFFAGSSNLVTPKATIDAVYPAYIFMAIMSLVSAIAFFFGRETKGKTIEEIDKMNEADAKL
jgi:putative MFS transporter